MVGFQILVRDYGDNARVVFKGVSNLGVVSRVRWVKPTSGMVKINVDAAILEEGVVGLGMVVHNEEGDLVVGVKRLMAGRKANLAEVVAARFELIVTHGYAFANVELECDASMVVKVICGRVVGKTPLDLVFEDACVLGSHFKFFYCSLVRRVGNVVAHFTARLFSSS